MARQVGGTSVCFIFIGFMFFVEIFLKFFIGFVFFVKIFLKFFIGFEIFGEICFKFLIDHGAKEAI